MIEQLIKKDCSTGEYENMYPKTILEAVIDPSTGQTLDTIINTGNHIYLPFVGNSRARTRLQVPEDKRRKGLWITYESCKGKVTTEWYNSDDYSDDAWVLNENWNLYLQKDLIKEVVDKILTWYKA